MALSEQEGPQSSARAPAIMHRVLASPYKITNCLVLRLRNDDGREFGRAQQARQRFNHGLQTAQIARFGLSHAQGAHRSITNAKADAF